MTNTNALIEYLNIFFENYSEYEKTLGVFYILSYILKTNISIKHKNNIVYYSLSVDCKTRYRTYILKIIIGCRLKVQVCNEISSNSIIISENSIEINDRIKLPSYEVLKNLSDYLNLNQSKN